MTDRKYTISQALRRMKKLKGHLSVYQKRVVQSVWYPAEAEPTFSFKDSVAVRDDTRKELIQLSTAIALANANNYIEYKGKSLCLAAALRILQELKSQIAEYRSYFGLRNAKETEDKTTREKFEDITDDSGNFKGQRRIEVEEKTKIICNITLAEQAKAIERLEREFDELNDLLERANHQAVCHTDFELPL